MIIQNFYMLFIKAENVFNYLPKDGVVLNKKINNSVIFSSEDGITTSLGGLTIITKEQLSSLYISLFDSQTKNITYKDLSALNLQSVSNVKLPIFRDVDFNLSKIEIKNNALLTENVVIPFALSYCKEINQPSLIANNCYSLKIKVNANQKYLKLSDFGGLAIRNKYIKRLTTEGYDDGYLTLKDKNGKLLYNVPLSYFSAYKQTENLLLDDYLIDFESSYLVLTSSIIDKEILLTFYF